MTRRVSLVPAVAAAMAIVATARPARATAVRIELHPFRSVTTTDEAILAGEDRGAPVVVAGELRIPRPGTERLPAVVLIHGSGGVAGYVDDWVTRLNAIGVATFVVDSYTARGLTSISDDHGKLGSLVMMVDAYRALAVLARHPRIDPRRIALMGFSFGGQAVLSSTMRRFADAYAPPGVRFATFVALYPVCTTTYLHDDLVVDAPIRIFHGTADDLAPIAACRAYVERLRKAGRDATLTEYPGARHVFDWAELKPPRTVPQTENPSECRIEEVSPGRLVNSATRRPFTYRDPCVKRGATLAYDAAAHDGTVRAVTALVQAVLGARVPRRPPRDGSVEGGGVGR